MYKRQIEDSTLESAELAIPDSVESTSGDSAETGNGSFADSAESADAVFLTPGGLELYEGITMKEMQAAYPGTPVKTLASLARSKGYRSRSESYKDDEGRKTTRKFWAPLDPEEAIEEWTEYLIEACNVKGIPYAVAAQILQGV